MNSYANARSTGDVDLLCSFNLSIYRRPSIRDWGCSCTYFGRRADTLLLVARLVHVLFRCAFADSTDIPWLGVRSLA
jgi:hypothetical protein